MATHNIRQSQRNHITGLKLAVLGMTPYTCRDKTIEEEMQISAELKLLRDAHRHGRIIGISKGK